MGKQTPHLQQVAAIKAGAIDYLDKVNLELLPQAIRASCDITRLLVSSSMYDRYRAAITKANLRKRRWHYCGG